MDTVITLTPIDAQRFVKFQKHYELFSIMEQAGVFDIGYGKAIINVANNVVQNVVIEEVKWRK